MTHCTIVHSPGFANSVIGWLKGGTLTMTNCIASWKIWDDASLLGRVATQNCLVFSDFDGTIDLGGNLVGDPLFINAAGNNYRLTELSPAVDTGIDAGITVDLDGRPRDALPDMGVYEFTLANTPPVADNDEYDAVQNEMLIVDAAAGVLFNDDDVDEDTLMAELEDNVDLGSLTLNSDGSFEYSPL